jgi:D-serine deaminase-like pyridoxal phosphate-dependent protein
MLIHDLDTPALICDLDVLERNVANMAAHCRDIGMPLRPHTKSHKNPEIAHKQLRAGAIGICCQKLGDAEVMVAAGVPDVFLPYNIVGAKKVDRLLRLVKRATIAVACDSEDTARGISEQAEADGVKVRVLIELDTGAKRCGAQSPQAALELAQKMDKMPGLDLQGVMTYPSRHEAKPFLDETVELLKKSGLPVHVISGGGTGSEVVSKEIGCTEHRSGSYAFEGMTRIGGSHALNPERCAVRVIVTVVSTPTPDRIILDGGQKTFTSYPPKPYGHVIECPQAQIYAMSVEHGHVDVSQCSHTFRVGERLSVIPLHQEMTTNLHDEMYGVRGEKVEVIWQVAGRGKVR